jgi:DNA-binding transcriptional LysR family regulator
MSITTSRVKRRDLEAELASGSLDLAIDIPMTTSEPIHQERLIWEPFVVMARAGHPGISQPGISRTLDLDTYLGQPHVLVSSRRYGASLIDVELSRLGFRRKIALRCQHNFAACQVVRDTDLLLTLSAGHAQILNAGFGNRIRIYPFPVKTAQLEAQMYWHESVENDSANRWLRQQIKSVLSPQTRTTAGSRRAAVRTSRLASRDNGAPARKKRH